MAKDKEIKKSGLVKRLEKLEEKVLEVLGLFTKAIRNAAEEAYESEIIETVMEDVEVESSAFESKKDFKEDWIGSKVDGWFED